MALPLKTAPLGLVLEQYFVSTRHSVGMLVMAVKWLARVSGGNPTSDLTGTAWPENRLETQQSQFAELHGHHGKKERHHKEVQFEVEADKLANAKAGAQSQTGEAVHCQQGIVPLFGAGHSFDGQTQSRSAWSAFPFGPSLSLCQCTLARFVLTTVFMMAVDR
ncbi:hypothetical protein TYRP_019611 [Tyrophagus putrescentiae]|nr:hypothetical protein TYRP_019611 [Tyrophagus putrescentiae]